MCYKYLLGWLLLLWMGSFSATAQEDNVSHELEKNSSILDRFSQRCERRTDKALRRMQRYEDKLKEKTIENAEKKAKTKGGIRKRNLIPFDEYGENPQKRKMDSIQMAQREEFAIREDSIRAHQPKDVNRDGISIRGIESSSGQGLGKEPLLDSLQLASGFMQYASPSLPTTGNTVNQSIDRAKSQLDMTGRVKSELYRQRDYWKSQLKEHPEYRKYVEKLDKECYYYSAQINKYRSALRDPSVLDDHLMNVLRRDPRFSDFLATLPAKPQDPGKMQPRQLVQQMMQSQAAAIDEDPSALIKGAKEKGSKLLGDLSDKSTEIGNIENATQVPEFKPDPYKTKSFWEHFDIGFNLEFDRRTFHLPSSGVAGLQLTFNFNERFSSGALVNYRFGMGEIKHIRFSHQGAGYGLFFNSKIWKNLGAQAGYERNWRTDTRVSETVQFDAGWTTSALAGLTYEYSIGKKMKATVGVFYDFLYKKHRPETNVVLWRMGWKM